MPSIDNAPFSIALWSYKPLLKWIKLEDFLHLISSLLLEKSIFVVGSNAEEIIKTTAFLPQLISPFLWVCPLISILPPNLEEILEFADTINKVDTDNIDETIGINENYNVFRKDEIKVFEDTESLLQNAMEKEQNMFKIPKVL